MISGYGVWDSLPAIWLVCHWQKYKPTRFNELCKTQNILVSMYNVNKHDTLAVQTQNKTYAQLYYREIGQINKEKTDILSYKAAYFLNY